MHLISKFRSGKYRGCSLLFVIENDLQYIEWMMENKGLKLDNEAYLKYQETELRA